MLYLSSVTFSLLYMRGINKQKHIGAIYSSLIQDSLGGSPVVRHHDTRPNNSIQFNAFINATHIATNIPIGSAATSTFSFYPECPQLRKESFPMFRGAWYTLNEDDSEVYMYSAWYVWNPHMLISVLIKKPLTSRYPDSCLIIIQNAQALYYGLPRTILF